MVAVHGLVPLRMKVGKSHLTASCSCDLAADPDARGAGMRIKLAAMSPEVSPLHISTSANESANKITLALNGKEAPGGRRKLIKPLRTSSFVDRVVRERVGWVAPAATFVASTTVDAVLALGRTLASAPAVSDAKVEQPERFDGRFDQLWERIVQDRSIIVVRDAAYLNWRYAKYPFAGVKQIALTRGEKVLGLAVWHQTVDEDGLPFAVLLELMVPKGEDAVAEHLLTEVVRRVDRNGVHSLTARTCDPSLETLMLRRGFIARNARFSPVTYRCNTDLPEHLFAGSGNWYMSLGDGDICYFY